MEDLFVKINKIQWVLLDTFRKWVQTIRIENVKTKYKFDNSCYFINFNYTNTLQKVFNVADENICHIHGKATEPQSIIVGHSRKITDRIDVSNAILYGGYVKFDYICQQLLDLTNKNVHKNINKIYDFLSYNIVEWNQINKVIVLGHSFGTTDWEYFNYIIKINASNAIWHIVAFDKSTEARVQEFMKHQYFKNYVLYKTIDECLNENGFLY